MSLYAARRSGPNGEFGEAIEIVELRDQPRPMSPSLSSDGLTLYFNRNRADGTIGEIAFTTRPNRSAKWSEPQTLPIDRSKVPVGVLTNVHVMPNGLSMVCVIESRPDKRNQNLMVWRRSTVEDAFSDFEFLKFAESQNAYCLTPRYVTATKELFIQYARPGLDKFRLATIKNLVLVQAAENLDKDDLTLLNGKWLAVAEENDGKRMKKADVKKMEKTLQIDGDKFELSWSGRTIKGNLEILPDEQPAALDLSGKLPTGKSVVLRGIYELKDDTLRLCYSIYTVNGDEVERPKEFETEEGTRHICVTYQRQK